MFAEICVIKLQRHNKSYENHPGVYNMHFKETQTVVTQLNQFPSNFKCLHKKINNNDLLGYDNRLGALLNVLHTLFLIILTITHYGR